jgi:hypothetical protein
VDNPIMKNIASVFRSAFAYFVHNAASRRYDDALGIAATQPEKVLEVALLYRLLELFMAR